MERGKYRSLARGIIAWRLKYWQDERDKAGRRFLNQPKPRPSILFNKDFHRYQIAWGKIGTLEAKLDAFKKGRAS